MSVLKPSLTIYLNYDFVRKAIYLPLSDYETTLLKLKDEALKCMPKEMKEPIEDEAAALICPYGVKTHPRYLSFEVISSNDFIDISSLPYDKTGNYCLLTICDQMLWGVEKYGILYIAAMNYPLISTHEDAVMLCETVRRHEQLVDNGLPIADVA